MQILKNHPSLQHNPLSHLFSFPIHEVIQLHQFERGEWIVREGTPPNYLFYVLEGTAKIYMTHQNGKISLLNFIMPFEFIGEMELLQASFYSKGVQTSTKVTCLAIPYTCRDQILEDPLFLRHLCLFLSEKTAKMTIKYSTSLAFPLENRLAEFILQTADGDIYKEKHVTVCDYLGVSYRHLLHVLAQFCEQQILKKDGRYYRILNEEALQKLAGVLQHQ